MRQVSRARAEELAARQNRDDGPVDVVAAVRAAEWEIWAAWLLGEDPAAAINLLPHGQRQKWLQWIEHQHGLRKGRGRSACHALGRWSWISSAATARKVSQGSALYVVSRGRLRLRIELDLAVSDARSTVAGLCFQRACKRLWIRKRLPDRSHPLHCGCPVAIEPVTLERDVPSPRGMRRRWWPRDAEIPCPDWRGAALGLEEGEQL